MSAGVTAGAAALQPVTPQGLVAALLEELAGESDDPRLKRALALARGLEPYVEAMTSPPSPALDALAERTRAHDWQAPLEAEMLSGHAEGALLQALVRSTRATRVLEIGMFTGYAALAMAEALPPHGRVVACELDGDVATFARECFARSEHGAKIEVHIGPAADTLAELDGAAEPFDLVFLDADKAGYRGYLETLLDGDLLAPGATVCVDNTLMQGQPWTGEPTANGEAIAAFNAWLAAEPRVTQVLLAVRDGVTLLQRV